MDGARSVAVGEPAAATWGPDRHTGGNLRAVLHGGNTGLGAGVSARTDVLWAVAQESVRGYIRGNPVAILMADVMGLFCCYVPWSLVMVSIVCLMALVPCDGSDV